MPVTHHTAHVQVFDAGHREDGGDSRGQLVQRITLDGSDAAVQSRQLRLRLA
jgi:hypothetical protein